MASSPPPVVALIVGATEEAVPGYMICFEVLYVYL
jgi:hypothetical protein